MYLHCFPLTLIIPVTKPMLFKVQSDEEGRNVAYDALNGLSSKLRSSADSSFDGMYHKLLTMVSALLSHSFDLHPFLNWTTQGM